MAAKKGGIQRLRKELSQFLQEPAPHIQVAVHEKDMFEWHYLLEGPPDTPYFGGWYYGRLRFPPEYPYKPPAIMMTTPSGRFETDRRLCLSISDFHPESWNPMWSVASVLTGLLSFMTGTDITTGAVETTEEEKKKLAIVSMDWNLKHPTFNKFFPDAKEYARRKALGLPTDAKSITLLSEKEEEEGEATNDSAAAAQTPPTQKQTKGQIAEPASPTTPGNDGSSLDGSVAKEGDVFVKGQCVVMCGLSAKNAHYNGIKCIVQGIGDKGRVRILLPDGKELLMKPANLAVDTSSEGDAEGAKRREETDEPASTDRDGVGGAKRSPSTEELVTEITRLKLEHDDWGVKRIHTALKESDQGWEISEKRLRKVMTDAKLSMAE